jgi:hypothetical protein
MMLLYVKYRDHLLFKNADPSLFKPNVREVVGWLTRETDEALFLTYDRSIEPLPFEKCESGLIILKSEVLERREIE